MKILYALDALFPDGLSETDAATLDLAVATQHAGHRVQIVVGGTEGVSRDRASWEALSRGIPVVALRPRGDTAGYPETIADHPYFVGDGHPDVIHIMSPMAAAATLEHLPTTPYIVTLSDTWFLCSHCGVAFDTPTDRAQQACDCALAPDGANDAQRIVGRALAVAAPSRRVAQWCTRTWDVRDVVHIPYGVRHDHLTPNTRCHRDGDQVVFAYVGALVPSRGLELLLEAFRSVASGQARLKIAGAGPDASYIRRLAAIAALDERIEFSIAQGPAAGGDTLSGVDALVLPSLWDENAPAILYEALGREIPVIGSAVTGIDELVVHGEHGLLFARGDSPGLAAALHAVATKPALLTDWKGHIRRMVIPALEQHAYAYERLYRSVSRVRSAESTRSTTTDQIRGGGEASMEHAGITPTGLSGGDEGEQQRLEGLERDRTYLIAHTQNLERALRSLATQRAALKDRLRELEASQAHCAERIRDLEQSERAWRASYLKIANSLTWRVMRAVLPPVWALHRALFRSADGGPQESRSGGE